MFRFIQKFSYFLHLRQKKMTKKKRSNPKHSSPLHCPCIHQMIKLILLSTYLVECKAGHRSTLRSSVFAFWHRASVYVRLSAYLRDDESSTCMCLRLREQCLRSEITSVSRVANVLLLRFVVGNMDVNTPASKRSQLIGNTAIV